EPVRLEEGVVVRAGAIRRRLDQASPLKEANSTVVLRSRAELDHTTQGIFYGSSISCMQTLHREPPVHTLRVAIGAGAGRNAPLCMALEVPGACCAASGTQEASIHVLTVLRTLLVYAVAAIKPFVEAVK